MACSCGNASPSRCQETFDEIMAKEFSDYRFGRVHRLTIDTYSLQHPDPYMVSPKSFAAHLTGMCCAMDYHNDQELLGLSQKWLNGRKQLEKPELLEDVGRLTISHIVDAVDGLEHEQRVKEWARDVWIAYSVYHDLARKWIETAQREVTGKPHLLS